MKNSNRKDEGWTDAGWAVLSKFADGWHPLGRYWFSMENPCPFHHEGVPWLNFKTREAACKKMGEGYGYPFRFVRLEIRVKTK